LRSPGPRAVAHASRQIDEAGRWIPLAATLGKRGEEGPLATRCFYAQFLPVSIARGQAAQFGSISIFRSFPPLELSSFPASACPSRRAAPSIPRKRSVRTAPPARRRRRAGEATVLASAWLACRLRRFALRPPKCLKRPNGRASRVLPWSLDDFKAIARSSAIRTSKIPAGGRTV